MSKLEQRRRKKGMSRQQLANAVGVTYEEIGHYENGKREPKTIILKKMAIVLGCRMEDLI